MPKQPKRIASAPAAPTEATDVALVEGGDILSQDQLDALAAEEAELQARLQREAEVAREKLLTDMGAQFKKEFDEAKTFRLEAERRWIEDLRQYKGLYEPSVASGLKTKKRSRLFLRLTRAKVKSLNARLGDMLFPAGDKNWTIGATPVPTLDPVLWAKEIEEISQARGEVDRDSLRKAINEVARVRCEKMATTIDDQLEEGSYEAECRKVIHSGNVFGTGILKGPLGTPRMSKRWRRDEAGRWTQASVREVKPYYSAVPIWYYYPDPLATEARHCRYEFEYRPMTAGEIAALKDDPAFMAERIDLVLKKFPAGNQNQLEQWEADLRQISREQDNRPNPINRFQLLERWGKISGKLLAAAGVAEVDEERDYEGQVWMVGDIVIRVDINPYDSGSRPFKLFYLDKDETSIWGEGLPSIMRDMQQGGNTALRALVDNAAMTAVPNLEVNTSLMDDEQDLHDFSGGRVWHRIGKGQDSQYPAVRVLEIPNKTNEFMSILKLFMELGDEVSTVPRYTYGINDGAAVSKTVGGMSMFMGQANISLKDIAKNWDDGITTPFISDMYAWNMQFNDDEDIKGDYDVVARGASSLVAKELRANALSQFTADLLKMAPDLAKVRELFAERARNLDLDPDLFLKTEEEMVQDNQEKQMAEAAILTVQTIAKAMGMAPEQLVQNVDQVVAQLSDMMKTMAGADGAGTDEAQALGA